jgi:hypothetical protein
MERFCGPDHSTAPKGAPKLMGKSSWIWPNKRLVKTQRPPKNRLMPNRTRSNWFLPNMHRLFPFIFALLIVTGCASGPQPIWNGDASTPLTSLPTPSGFSVTPAQAEATARASRQLPLKVVYHVYADSQFYYVCDGFLGSSRRAAVRRGLKIDGQTGQIVLLSTQ